MLGYVVSDTGSFHTAEDLKRVTFRVNSGYAKFGTTPGNVLLAFSIDGK